jgi:endonuclease YncB( thermonuclease family)
VFAYGYPVFVGGYPANDDPAEPAPQQQPDTTVIDPPQPAPAIVERFGSDDAQDPTTPTAAADDLQPVEEPPSTAEPSHYLIAFKDHSIYSAVAYWVDGDTLHYFTSGNTHNQVSVSLVDRDLTERLNEESGLELKLPPPTPIR